MKFDDLDCYVIHYTKANNRKEHIQSQLKNLKIENKFKWIESHDKEDVSYIQYTENFGSKIPQFNLRTPPSMKGIVEDFFIKPSEVSCALKHKQALIEFTNTKNPYFFVIEDDVIFADNFVNKLNQYFNELPDDWDVLFIGSGGNKQVPQNELVDGKKWYYKQYPADRCADAIIMKRNAAKCLLYHINTHGLIFPYDHELSFWLNICCMNVYWLHPPLIVQGSQNGKFKSLLGNTENLL